MSEGNTSNGGMVFDVEALFDGFEAEERARGLGSFM